MLVVKDWGEVAYQQAWDRQKDLVCLRDREKSDDHLIFVSHPHVYTVGRNPNPAHLRYSAAECRSKGIAICPTDRGGQVTYHGPGQLVCYPIIASTAFGSDAHRYMDCLERCLIEILANYGVFGSQKRKYRGVWIGEAKIASIGVKFTKRRYGPGYITSHGFALNVTTDLSYFAGIVPCGLTQPVTSLVEVCPEYQGDNQLFLTLKQQIASTLCTKLDYDKSS